MVTAKRASDIGESQICDIPQFFSIHSPSLHKHSHLLPNVHQTFYRFFGNVQNSRDYSGTLTFYPNARTVAVFTKYSLSCGKIIAGFAICSPNSSNSLIDRHARQLVAKCLWSDLKPITFSSPNDSRIDVTERCKRLTIS